MKPWRRSTAARWHPQSIGHQPLYERDPLRRLENIRATTEHLKDSKQALGASVLTQVGEWTPSTLLALGARLAVTALPFQLRGKTLLGVHRRVGAAA